MFTNLYQESQDRGDRPREKRPTSKGGKNRNPLPPKFPKQGDNNNNNMNQLLKTLFMWGLMIVGVYLLISLFKDSGEPQEYEVSATYYQQLLTDGQIASGKVEQYGMNQYRFHGVLRQKKN